MGFFINSVKIQQILLIRNHEFPRAQGKDFMSFVRLGKNRKLEMSGG